MDQQRGVTRLIDVQELAGLWSVSPHTIRAWVQEKRLNPTRICRRLLLRQQNANVFYGLEMRADDCRSLCGAKGEAPIV